MEANMEQKEKHFHVTHNGKCFKVKLAPYYTCQCPKYMYNGSLCEHMYFAMIYFLKMRNKVLTEKNSSSFMSLLKFYIKEQEGRNLDNDDQLILFNSL